MIKLFQHNDDLTFPKNVIVMSNSETDETTTWKTYRQRRAGIAAILLFHRFRVAGIGAERRGLCLPGGAAENADQDSSSFWFLRLRPKKDSPSLSINPKTHLGLASVQGGTSDPPPAAVWVPSVLQKPQLKISILEIAKLYTRACSEIGIQNHSFCGALFLSKIYD